MSFSTDIKKSMVRNISNYSRRIDKVVCGIIQSSFAIKEEGEGKKLLFFSTENTAILRMLKEYSETLLQYNGICTIEKSKKGKNGMRYSLTLSDAELFLNIHEIQSFENEISSQISGKINHKVQRKKDYISGFFLGSGSISDPNKSYHLEFLCKSETQARNLINLLEDVQIKAKYVNRASFWVVYIKDSEIIADLLSVMGADAERFEFENTKIIKELRNKVNRQLNCDYANIDKTVEVSRRQVEAIELIESKIGLESLSDKLREAAEIRLKEPELNLIELGKLLDPPLGKSGMNHRLKKIEKIAESLMIED